MSGLHKILDMTMDGLGDLAKADIVTGKPVQINDKTLIPILQLSVSLGGGGGTGEGEGVDRKRPQGGKGTGGLAAGGAQLTPVAVIVKDTAGVRILKVPQAKKGIEKWIDKIPELVEKIKALE